jgi:hypothetical protein
MKINKAMIQAQPGVPAYCMFKIGKVSCVAGIPLSP